MDVLGGKIYIQKFPFLLSDLSHYSSGLIVMYSGHRCLCGVGRSDHQRHGRPGKLRLFWRVECSLTYPCQGLDKHAHFRNFGMAFLTLFRVATGDNWNGIMKVRNYTAACFEPLFHCQ